jgi:hypothetical protein
MTLASLMLAAFAFQAPAAADHNQHVHAFLLADADNHSNTANILNGKLQVGDEAGPLTVDGTINVGNSGDPIEVTGDVLVGDGSGPLTVDGDLLVGDGTGPLTVDGTVDLAGPVTTQPGVPTTPIVASFEEQFNAAGQQFGSPSHQVHEGAANTTHLAISSITLTGQVDGTLIVRATDCSGNFTGGLYFFTFVHGSSMTHFPFPQPLIVEGRCLELTQSTDFGGALVWGTIGGYEI